MIEVVSDIMTILVALWIYDRLQDWWRFRRYR